MYFILSNVAKPSQIKLLMGICFLATSCFIPGAGKSKAEKEREKQNFKNNLIGTWEGGCENAGSDSSKSSGYEFHADGSALQYENTYGARDCQSLYSVNRYVMTFEVKEIVGNDDSNVANVQLSMLRQEMLYSSSVSTVAANLAKLCGYNDWEANTPRTIETGSSCYIGPIRSDMTGGFTIGNGTLTVKTVGGDVVHNKKI